MNIVQTVTDAAIKLIKTDYPDVDVYGEEIPVTAEEDKNAEWFFVKTEVTGIETESELQTRMNLLVLIDYHAPDETNRKYVERFTELDSLIRPVFVFSDLEGERLITVASINMNISGRLLHISFPLEFITGLPEPEGEPMEELGFDFNKED